MRKQRVIAIVGPTASGKTELAIALAQKFNGEIISADSRAIYRGLDIGTAKPTPSERKLVPHYLIDIANVGERFTVVQFQKLAQQAIDDIARRGKVPLLVGGTGLYVDAVLQNFQFPPEGDPELRFHLEQESDERLGEILKTIDPEAYRAIDLHNRRRVLRSVEVALTAGESFVKMKQKRGVPFAALIIGLALPREELLRRIDARFDDWVERGLFDEVRWVLDETSPDWVASLGLHYRYLALCIQREISRDEAFAKSRSSLHALARRQMTWFRKNKEIHWVTSPKEASRHVKKFLGS